MLQASSPSLLPSFLPLNPGVLCRLLEWSPAGTGRPTKDIHTHLSYLEQPSAALLPSSAHPAASLHLAGLPKPSCHNPRMPCLCLSGSDGICTWADGEKRGVPCGVHRGHHACFTSERVDVTIGNRVGEGHLPRSLIHYRLQQPAPYLLAQGTSHTQDLPTGTQMLTRGLAPTTRSTATSPHPRQAKHGGFVLLSPSSARRTLWVSLGCC